MNSYDVNRGKDVSGLELTSTEGEMKTKRTHVRLFELAAVLLGLSLSGTGEAQCEVQKLTPQVGIDSVAFGSAVSVDDDVCIVSAPNSACSAGAAITIPRKSNIWLCHQPGVPDGFPPLNSGGLWWK